MKRMLLLAVLGTAIFTVHAQGTFEAIWDFSAPTVGAVAGTAGFTFTPATPITVTDLGYLDEFTTTTPVEIGLWDASQGPTAVPLATALVSSTNVLGNLTRYASITPVLLAAGKVYTVGAYSPGGNISLHFLDFNSGDTVIADPTNPDPGAIQFDDAAEQDPAHPSFGQPTLLFANGLDVGANFRYQNANAPEPGTWTLIGLGGALLIWRRRS